MQRPLGSNVISSGRCLPASSRVQLIQRQRITSSSARSVKLSAKGEKFDAQVTVVLGTQWGDEGKGKLVDILAQQYDIVARAQVRMFLLTTSIDDLFSKTRNLEQNGLSQF